MTRTIFYTATTLDGYLADEYDRLDWLFSQPQEPGGPMNYESFIPTVGAIAMGATTYDWIADHLRSTGEKWSYEVPAWIFSHHPREPMDGADLRFVSGNVAAPHADMVQTAGDRNIWVVGGGDLATQFAAAGLLDELMLSIAPVTLGAGRPLFSRPFDLTLTELAQNGAFACARYKVVGARS